MDEVLAGIEGQFILSLNDTPDVRATFAAFRIDSVDTTYSISGAATAAQEVLITNVADDPLFAWAGPDG